MIGATDLRELAGQIRSGVLARPIDHQHLAAIIDGVATYLESKQQDYDRLLASYNQLKTDVGERPEGTRHP